MSYKPPLYTQAVRSMAPGEMFGAAFRLVWFAREAGCRVSRLKLTEDEVQLLREHTGQEAFLLGVPVVKR